jgi:hypothetical protein
MENKATFIAIRGWPHRSSGVCSHCVCIRAKGVHFGGALLAK